MSIGCLKKKEVEAQMLKIQVNNKVIASKASKKDIISLIVHRIGYFEGAIRGF